MANRTYYDTSKSLTGRSDVMETRRPLPPKEAAQHEAR